MPNVSQQLQAMRSMPENWDGYGASPPQPGVIDLAQEFVALMDSVLTRSAGNPLPLHVSPTRAGGVLIEWENGLQEHEVEINPDHSISFLHRDKSTGRIETRQFSAGQEVVPPGFLHELRQLLAA